ncbi:MAG: putative murein endopeptidase [Anaerocolumna sp.]|jgi:hypothetical protein|nr:putative murein endopeptidase [Anaerocolumna sp.]
MKNLIKGLFWLTIVIIVLYTLNDKYHFRETFMSIDVLKEESNEEDFVAEVRKAMLNGLEELTLQYIGPVEDMEWFTEDVIDKVYRIDDPLESGDYDYLRYKANSIYAHIVGFGNNMTISYEFKYNETAEQTQQVDEIIQKLFRKWDMNQLSDLNKIKKIHDFIIQNASYDTDTLNYSTYDNLVRKSSTCQGYMSLAYKMFTEAGIPSRIITGTGNKDSHGWNIVYLEGKWYNIDCTWDDPITLNGKDVIIYDYYLKSEEEFKGHLRDAEFTSEEFLSQYPIAEKSYETEMID